MPIRLLLTLLILFVGCQRAFYHPARAKTPCSEKNEPPTAQVFFNSEDGTRLHGWFQPATKTVGRATVVFFHGNAGHLRDHYPLLNWVTDYGYDYFIFDYRGYGCSDGNPSPRGTVADGMAALHWVAKEHPQPIVVVGQSLGGIIALQTALNVKEQLPIKLIVADSTFASYQSVARQHLRRSIITWSFQWLGKLLIDDTDAPRQQIQALSPIPVIVIHGTRDNTVPYQLGVDIYRMLTPPKELWTVPNGRHIDAVWRHKATYRPRLISRFDHYTNPNAQSLPPDLTIHRFPILDSQPAFH